MVWASPAPSLTNSQPLYFYDLKSVSPTFFPFCASRVLAASAEGDGPARGETQNHVGRSKPGQRLGLSRVPHRPTSQPSGGSFCTS